MPPGAVAVILLLNGLQIAMPAPAFVLEGRAWLPARAVMSAAGWQVSYDAARDLLLLDDGPGPAAQIHGASSEATVGGQARSISAAPRRVADTLYLPADAFALLGMSPRWQSETRTVHLQTPQATVPVLSIRELKADPFVWLQREVTVVGEYHGPLEAGTWLLRDREDALACRDASSVAREGLARERLPRQVGERFEVTGRVQMSSDASMLLDITESHPCTGPAAVTCAITTAREVYRIGQTVLIELEMANLTGAPIAVGLGQPASLAITDPSGEEVWSELLQMPQTVAVGYHVVTPHLCRLPENLTDGRYTLHLRPGRTELWAAQWCFTVVSRAQEER